MMVARTIGLTAVLTLLLALPGSAGEASRTSINIFAAEGRSLVTWHGRATMRSINLEWGRNLTARTELLLVAAPHVIEQPKSWFGHQYGDGNETVKAGSVSLLGRHRFRVGHRLEPYVEVGTGPMWATRAVPAATSRFNFNTQAGFGVALSTGGNTALMIGYRFNHISNGGYAPRNPGLNINALLMGTSFHLR